MRTRRTGVYSREQLRRLLHPTSIAVIGASSRAGSFGERVLHNMRHYAGRAYPVNGRYQTIGDRTCYPNVRDLPEVPDCAVITAAREAKTVLALYGIPVVGEQVTHSADEAVNADPLFGPLIVVGFGGILVELLKDTALSPAPVTPREAEGLLRQLKGVKLLEGFRGMPAVDIARLAQVISDVSRFAADHRDLVAELDVNPLICAGDRITAVDALIVVS